jgi:hypothetical protein
VQPSMAARTIDFATRDTQSIETRPQPPPAPITSPIPTSVLPNQMGQTAAPTDEPPIKRDFTPPPKIKTRRRWLAKLRRSKVARTKLPRLPVSRRGLKKVMPIVMPALGALVVIGAIIGYFHWQAVRNNPTRVFQDALQSSLSTQQITTQTSGGGLDSTVNHDFGVLTNPIVSSQSTIKLFGSNFDVAGFGTAQNSYVSYTGLPSIIPASLAKVVKNSWVQLRVNGVQPPGISGVLTNLADPRYQSFGPVLFANLPAKDRQQIMTYIAANHIYKYSVNKVTHTQVGGIKAVVYAVKLNADSLKVINQSAAVSEGFSPSDVEAATTAISNLKNASTTFYVSSKTHRFLQVVITQNGQTTTMSYSNYDQVTLPNEPVTQLGWTGFAPDQYQLETQAASHQTGAQRDAEREAQFSQLHSALATYFSQNGSYPTFANLNDQSWIATNLPGLDPEVFRDPQGSSLALATAATVNSFSYQPQPDGGVGVCDDSPNNLCTHYKLITILSTNQPYIVQDP